jgi:hypothetical protein
MQVLGVCTLTERVMRAGGSSLYARDWQTRFHIDSTLIKLLRRFYEDGRYAAKHATATKDRDFASKFFALLGPRGSIAAIWQFTSTNFRIWRFADRALVLYLPAFLVLLLVSLARQIGLIVGLGHNGKPTMNSLCARLSDRR